MCLSTVYKGSKSDDNVCYRNSQSEDNICAKYVAKIDVDGDTLTFTDVLGEVTKVEGRLVSADLTAGVVVFDAA